ncbi:MAG: hypothetical protein FJ316_12425 [SAR202 cluster bacterium]|nr:hypothetical protein [SAR202 cluster bacterium]
MLYAILAHQGDADPTLLGWIKDQLDHLLGLGPWAAVILLGLLTLAMPAAIVALYLVQQRRQRTGDRAPRP